MGLIHQASRFDEFDCIEGAAATIALVASGIIKSAMGANSFHKTIGEESMYFKLINQREVYMSLLRATFAVRLCFFLSLQESVFA